MAISTLDALVASFLTSQDVVKVGFTAEAAGVIHSGWTLAGMPGAGTNVASGVAGTTLFGPSVPGQVLFPAAVAGKAIYLARMEAVQGGNIGAVVLCDRIWQNSGLSPTTTTAQTVNSVTWDRDNIIDGTFTGHGVLVGVEVTTTLTNAAAVSGATVSYTNQAGTAGRIGSLGTIPATALAGTVVPMALQAGDYGVRSIQSITHPTLTGGAYSLIAYRQIAALGTPVANVGVQQDGLTLGLPMLHNDSVPFLMFLMTGTAGGATDISITWAQG